MVVLFPEGMRILDMKIGTERMEDEIMKKYLFLAAMTVSMIIAACTREQEVDIPDQRLTILAKTETSDDTRTIVEGETHVYWEPGDEISVFSGDRSGKFVTDLISPSATASFTGTLGEDSWTQGQELWAVYPYSEEVSFDKESASVITTLPSVQYARADSFGKDMNLAIAHSTDNTLQFYNVGGGVRFSITEEGVKRVVFEGLNDEYLSGKIRVHFTDTDVPDVKQVIDGSKFITVLPPSGEDAFQTGKWYYIVAIPQSLLRGYKLRFYKDTDYASRTSGRPVNILRSRYGTISRADAGINYNPRMTPFPKTEEEWYASELLAERVLSKIYPLIASCMERAQTGEDVLDYFISNVEPMDEIADAYRRDMNDGVIVVLNNGVHYNVILNENNVDTRAPAYPEVLANSVVSQREEFIIPDSGKKRAMLYSPYQTFPFGISMPITIDEYAVEQPLKLSGYGLVSYLGVSASIDALAPDNLAQYDLLLLATHGSISEDMNGNQVENCIMTSSTSYRKTDIAPGAYGNLTGFFCQDKQFQKFGVIRYGVGAEALKKAEEQVGIPSFKNTIVMAMACFSYSRSDLADYFMSRGASFYCGNDGVARIGDMRSSVPAFVNYLSWGYPAQEAFRRIKQDYPKMPLISTQKEEPIYLVDPRPTNLTSSVSSSRVTLEWKVAPVRWNYSFDLYIDDELVASELTGRQYITRVYNPGVHSWYLETRIPYEDGESAPFRTPVETFTVGVLRDVVDLGLSVNWASFNLGGLCPEDRGDLYAWGETEPQSYAVFGADWYSWESYKWSVSNSSSLTKYCVNSTYGYDGFTDGKSVLEPEDDAAHCHLGGGFRIPTRGELQELLDNCLMESAVLGGVSGYKFTSLVPGYTDKWIFIVFGGSSSLYPAVWSSNLDTSRSLNAWSCLRKGEMKSQRRPDGLPIRPVCDK